MSTLTRKLYTREELMDHYRQLSDPFALCRDDREMEQCVKQCLHLPSLILAAFQKGIKKEKRLVELIGNYYTLKVFLGKEVTRELVHIARYQTLSALFGTRQTFMDEMIPGQQVDLQVVVLLTVVRTIAQSQDFEDPSLFTIRLLEELDINDEFREKAIHTAVSAELAI